MSTFEIPNNQGLITQATRSDTNGSIVESYNLDLTSKFGKIKVAKKLQQIINSADDEDWGDIVAFAIYETQYYVFTGVGVYKCSTSNDITIATNWTQENDFGTNNTSLETDAVVFDGLLLVSEDNDIGSYDGSTFNDDWWTTITRGGETGLALTSNVPHTMHVHRGGQETLFVTDGNKVLYANNTAGHSTVTLQTDLAANCISGGVNATWVGTYSESNANALVYEIYVGEQKDSVPIARNAYPIEGRAVLSITVINNIPHIITEKGKIQAFNGAGFTTVASFPFAHTVFSLDNIRPGSISNNPLNLPVHPKGMQQYGDSVLIFINTELEGGVDSTADYPEFSPTGVWEYSTLSKTLNHRYALSDSDSQFGGRVGGKSSPILVTESADSIIVTGGEQQDGTNGLYAETSSTNIGTLITTEIESGTVQDAYEAVYVKAKTLSDGESINLRYRTIKKDNQFADVTLSGTNTVNTTDTLTGVEVGDEVTTITGTLAGTIASVIAVDTSSSVTVLTLDTVVGVIGTAIKIEVTNFKIHPDTYTREDKEYKKFGVGEVNPWIQYKLQMKGDIEVRGFISKGNSKTEL
jgi:hypothetical protein